MKKALFGFLFMSAFFVPIFLNLQEGEKAGKFWDGEDKHYVYRGEGAYDAAIFNRRMLLCALPILFGIAAWKNR